VDQSLAKELTVSSVDQRMGGEDFLQARERLGRSKGQSELRELIALFPKGSVSRVYGFFGEVLRA
jgi:hypothetical protein